MRRLLQVCRSEPSNSKAIADALLGISLSEFPKLCLHDTLAPQKIECGSILDLLKVLRRPTTITLFRNETIDVTLWALPASACLPLHDHPGMTVHNRLLHGRIHQLALDWIPNGAPFEAVVVENQWRSADDDPPLEMIDPNGGGVLHAFTVQSAPAVFVDVISPPYFTPPTNAKCTYYDCPALDLMTTSPKYANRDELRLGMSCALEPCAEPGIAMDYFTFAIPS